jgi:hypothetical protein
MAARYFGGKSWSEVTREERVFCAELYFHIRRDPDDFVRFLRSLKSVSNLPESFGGPWDVGYEVCLYRDYLHCFRRQDKGSGQWSLKRTLDLALFSDTGVIVIEAKAAEGFSSKQAKDLLKDRKAIPRLFRTEIPLHFIALASSRYFKAYDKYGKGPALKPFDGRLYWRDCAEYFGNDRLLKRAEDIYPHEPFNR